MTPTPEVQPLPHTQRRFVFIASLVIFCVTVPLLVFYAIGYRFDFTGDLSNIKTVGGMYVTSEVRDIEMYIDDEPVEDMRIFQSAAYIQNLEAGMHQIHVQGEGVQTWVKELPVFPHFVTEVQSFNMPEVPQTRILTEFIDINGTAIYFGATSSVPKLIASSTNAFTATTSLATSTYAVNAEYVYVQSLFASSSEESLLLETQRLAELKNRFSFGPVPTSTESIATTTKEFRNTRLYKDGEDVFIQWIGEIDDIPYYYCIRSEGSTSTAALYGDHVSTSLQAQLVSASNLDIQTETERTDNRLCRSTVRIDRMYNEVIYFDYFPNNRDLILMHLTDGLYVVEVDDRAWQNTQMLYSGEKIEVVLDGGQIFIKDGEYYLEVFTELQ